jgi:ketosteroid isomerase-like protein
VTRSAPEAVGRYWAAIAARDWSGLHGVLHPDVVLDCPVSDERITGPANVVAVNAEYSDGWSIRVLRLVSNGDLVASEVEVPMAGVGVFRVLAWWTVGDGLLRHGTEYWTCLGADPVPQWRQAYSTSLSAASPA